MIKDQYITFDPSKINLAQPLTQLTFRLNMKGSPGLVLY